MFRFKQFALQDSDSALKVTTDATILGAWVDIDGADTILDAGCGCGILGLMAAQRATGARITAVDIHPGSIADATYNVRNSPFADRIKVIAGDITELQGSFDLIISNPPFFTEALQSPDAARAAARHAGKFSHLTLPHLASKLLSPTGSVALIAPTEDDSVVDQALALAGLYPHRVLRFRQSERRPPVRTLWQAQRDIPHNVIQDQLTISGTEGYTPRYRELLSPFMLYF